MLTAKSSALLLIESFENLLFPLYTFVKQQWINNTMAFTQIKKQAVSTVYIHTYLFTHANIHLHQHTLCIIFCNHSALRSQ